LAQVVPPDLGMTECAGRDDEALPIR